MKASVDQVRFSGLAVAPEPATPYKEPISTYYTQILKKAWGC